MASWSIDPHSAYEDDQKSPHHNSHHNSEEKHAMRSMTRIVSGALAATVATVMVGAAPASAATAGVGATKTKTAVVNLQIGNLLNLGLLTDAGGANIDTGSGAPSAAASLVPITLSSPALHLNLSTPAI